MCVASELVIGFSFWSAAVVVGFRRDHVGCSVLLFPVGERFGGRDREWVVREIGVGVMSSINGESIYWGGFASSQSG